jgi:chaperonin cofactor prefoldin
MSNLRGFIDGLLAKRHDQKPKMESLQAALSRLGADVSGLVELANDTANLAESESKLKGTVTCLKDSLANLETRITHLQAKIANLMVRFGKNTVNVGVAGKARQGKSTLLQRISGLNDAVIPAGDGLPCTGAKSKIFHQEQDPHAEVDFYSEEEFVKGIVHAYYDELSLPHRPASLADFQRPLPPLPSPDVPEKHAVYKKFQELHQRLQGFSRYLSRASGRSLWTKSVPLFLKKMTANSTWR